MTELSVIIPVYNTETYLPQCLASAAALPADKAEIIVIDDGSTDGSPQICDAWAKGRRNAVVLHQPNRGVSAARNAGLARARGKYLLFLDSDDWLDAPAAEAALAYALHSGADILLGSFYRHTAGRGGKYSFFTFAQRVFTPAERLLLVQNCLVPCGFANRRARVNCGVPWARLYAAALVRRAGLSFVPGLTRMQDAVFNMEAFLCAASIRCTDIAFYHYRINKNAATNRYTAGFSAAAQKFLREAKTVLEQHKIYGPCRDACRAKALYLLLETVRLQLVPAPHKSTAEKAAALRRLADTVPARRLAEDSPAGYLDLSGRVFRRLLLERQYGLIIRLMSWRAAAKRKTMYD